MKKIVKRYGNSLVVIFSNDEKKIWNLQEGDVIDMTIDKPVNWNYLKRKVKENDKQKS